MEKSKPSGLTRVHEAPILLTGATGYIGSRLLRELEAAGCTVRCLARQPARVTANRDTTAVVAGDCLDAASLDPAMRGVDQAFYLVHSMASGARFAALDREAAANFGRAARSAGVRRIIYLGGLADDADSLSTHLKSRVETGEALRESGLPVVEFRASVVIGAGSLSYEMIRALVERLPAMICPRWVDTHTQPIAIDDVTAYLRAALDLPEGREGVFEIGGPQVVSYGDMLREYARLRGLRRALIPVPLLTPRLSGLWLGLVTPAQAHIGRALVEGLRNPTVVRSSAALETFAVRPGTLREALVRAIDEGGSAQFKMDRRLAVVDVPPARAFAPVRRIGGDTGWYFADALWRLRGWIDVWLAGAGMPRTRRDPEDCVVGDVIDGWRVDAYEPDRLLRLSAGLKLPGRGWLEFRVDPLDGGARSLIRQTATFDPKGIAGRLYWYGVLPLHALVFRGLLRRIAQRAVRDTAPENLARFTYSSVLDAPAAFRRHEQPGALAPLTPAALVRTAEQEVAIRDGSRVTPSIAFAHRHRVVRPAVGGARSGVAFRWAAAVALIAATTLPLAGAPAQTPPVRTVPFVDLDRYAGDWFEIARFPNRFQRQCVGDVRATYGRRPDGRVDVVNRCRTAEGESEARGVARIVDERTFAKLKVRFAPAWLSWLPMVWGDYWIIGLAPDYSWAVVGAPGRDYLWILARAPHLDDASTAAAQAAARDNGFDVTRLVPTPQAGGASHEAEGSTAAARGRGSNRSRPSS
jgi:lipocalin/uncharacterized protein YbjT (DUF2867 family)